MERLVILVFFTFLLTCLQYTTAEETVLSSVLTPSTEGDKLKRLSRSYYDYRYGVPRPIYDRLEYARLEYDRPRCGRCDDRRDDRDDRDDEYDRRDKYDDDRRGNRPTYGSRYDKKNYDSDEDRYSDRKGGQKNGTEDDNGDKKNAYDDKDRTSGSRRGSDRDRDRGGDRDRDRRRGGDRYGDRDRYRPDYYDRFLRDPYRERDYDELYRERRPLHDRYYPSYDDGLSRYDGYAFRRPAYDDRGYDDGYGGYGPSAGRGPHDSFRPWDETYRGQAGWDAGGRGYYFASGRPDVAPATGWGRPGYSRPQEIGYQNFGYTGGYSGGYRDPYAQINTGYGQAASYGQGAASYGQGAAGYGQGAAGYGQGAASYGQGASYSQGGTGYGQAGAGYAQSAGYGQSSAGYGQSSSGYGQGSGWHSVGERRPYRDESSVKKLENRDNYNQNSYDQSSRQPGNYGQTANYVPTATYGHSYQQGYGGGSSTTPGTSYLFQRDDEQVTVKLEDTTKQPS